MLKTDIEILEFIHGQPGHAADYDILRSFIGENAERRLSDLVHARLLKYDPHWNDNRSTTYALAAKGEALLAEHLQNVEKAIQRRADEDAEKERDRLQAKTREAKNRWFSLLSAIIGAAVGSVLTFLLDHHREIAAFVRRLFAAR